MSNRKYLPTIVVFCLLFVTYTASGVAQTLQESGAVSWTVPREKRVRVIIDSDAANESDDQAVISYALLSPALIHRGLVAAHFRPHPRSPIQSAEASMEASYEEIHALLRLMKLEGCVPVRRGSPVPFPDAAEPPHSEGADLIIEEAMRDDPHPLFVIFLGPLTDLAAAYAKSPVIAKRLTAVWIGGGAYPSGGPNYNQDNDLIAAQLVMESDIPLWQIPLPVYHRARFGLAEVERKVGRQGKLGRFLFERVLRFMNLFPPLTEFFQFADLPAVGVVLQQPWFGDFEIRARPSLGDDGYYKPNRKERTIRVLKSFDQRATLEDFFAKLAAFASGEIKPRCGDESDMAH